jgi:rhodanese-related sulfurtransferase
MQKKTISMLGLAPLVSHLSTNEIILDVRRPEEFGLGHVSGAINIPLDAIVNRSNELKKYSKIYLYCQAGRRSVMATEALEAQGFKNIVCVTESGMGDWMAAGLPVAY